MSLGSVVAIRDIADIKDLLGAVEARVGALEGAVRVLATRMEANWAHEGRPR